MHDEKFLKSFMMFIVSKFEFYGGEDMIDLPEEFLLRMKQMLGDEYLQFKACYQDPPRRGLRINTLKCTKERVEEILQCSLEVTPFSPLSYYFPQSLERIGTHPLHHAGAFYIQEPSASSAVTALDPKPGEHILDLCAAPGGKSTQIAALLQGKGLLWSNEIVKKRANILLSNIERMGIKNAIVSSCHPQILCNRLAGFFDRVLVDAPCSGEGMFRRDERAVSEWSVEHVKACSERQLEILRSAAQAVRDGGILVYSTCTFSQEENEEVIEKFLKESDFVLEPITESFGREGSLVHTRRIFPMDGGEGHFVARMRKKGEEQRSFPQYETVETPACKQAKELYESLFWNQITSHLVQTGDHIVILPQETPDLQGLGVVRAGVLMGEIKGKRIEPAHALFLSASPKELTSCIDFPADSPEIFSFLRGEELKTAESQKGFTGISVEKITVGFGKCSNGCLKNHYPKGLRNQK